MKHNYYSYKDVSDITGMDITTIRNRFISMNLKACYKKQTSLNTKKIHLFKEVKANIVIDYYKEVNEKKKYKVFYKEKKRQEEEALKYKPKYIFSETLIIPSKLNFLTLEQL